MSLAVTRGQRSPAFSSDAPDNVDRSFVARRLKRNAITLVSAHSRADYLGNDDLVESFARAKGFTADDLAILRVCIGTTRHTLICSPEQIWHARKFDLLELKSMAAFAGRNSILVPECAIQRQPRLGTARVIEDAFGVSVTLEQRMAILIHVIESGGTTTIMDCVCAIDHDQPFSAVIHLVGLGVLTMNSNAALTPHTLVRLPSAATA